MSFNIVNPSNTILVDKLSTVVRQQITLEQYEALLELEDIFEGPPGLHWGQRKLALAKLEFLLRYWDPLEHPEITVVEIGAAHGSNTLYISKLFPQIHWELYDPGTFDNRLRGVQQVTLHENEDGFFTDETAEHWAKERENGRKILLLSDIRNYPQDETDSALRVQYVERDLRSQERWCRTIRPLAAQLKFPLLRRERSGSALTNRYFKYLGGTTFLQAWNRRNSHETRLAVTDFDSEVYWDLDSAEYQIGWVNKYLRREGVAKAVADAGFSSEGVREAGLDNSWDAAVEILVWAHYLQKHGVEPTEALIAKLSNGLSKVLGGLDLATRLRESEKVQRAF